MIEITDETFNRGGHEISHPYKEMSIEERAHQMWAVHPVDLDKLQCNRQEFFRAHLESAVEQAIRNIQQNSFKP